MHLIFIIIIICLIVYDLLLGCGVGFFCGGMFVFKEDPVERQNS